MPARCTWAASVTGMHRRRTSALTALGSLTLAAALLTGCSTGGGDTAPTGGDSGTAREQPQEKPADLAGTWKTIDDASADAWQELTIAGETMTINWVSDNGKTTALYWAGSFTAPTAAGDYTWESKNDTAQTDKAMLASSDPTKTFTYKDGKISWQVSALGVTKEVSAEKQ